MRSVVGAGPLRAGQTGGHRYCGGRIAQLQNVDPAACRVALGGLRSGLLMVLSVTIPGVKCEAENSYKRARRSLNDEELC